MACSSDNALRILDTQQRKWVDVVVAPAGGSLLDPQRVPFPPTDSVAERLVALLPDPHPSAETLAAVLRDAGNALLGQLLQNWNRFFWITDRLFYSEGHLVLHQDPHSSLFINCNWLHVWKLEGQGENVTARHLYTKDLKGNCSSITPPQEPGTTEAASPPPDFPPAVKSVAVAPDGMFYLLREAPETDHAGVSYLIQSFDVRTGNCLANKTLRMPPSPPGANRPRYTNDTLRISGDSLWLSRHVEEEGPFPGIGLGVYSFARTTNLLQQMCFLPCFEEGEIQINEDRSRQSTEKWMLSCRVSEGFYRKIVIDGSGVLTHEDRRITFGDREEVKLARDNRVFVEDPDEGGDIRLDEYDVVTGDKIRTISTGVPREGHMVASVLCNGIEIFCVISAHAGSTNNVIQSFLL